MIHLLLTILKIIGILLLVILGILLTVILLVLFVPLRYRGNVFLEDKKPSGNVRISWLFRALRADFSLESGHIEAKVHVLWFRLMDTGKDETEDEAEDQTEVIVPEEKTGNRQSITREEPEEPVKEPIEKAVKEPRKKPVEKPDQPDHVRSASREKKRKNLLEKLRQKIRILTEKIRSLYQRITGSYESLKNKIDVIREFWENEENRKTIRLLRHQIGKLLRHILPRKMNGRVKFGFDDPAVTGQVLTSISPFYGWYAEAISVEPVFDEQMLEGELHFRGYVRAGTMLWMALRVWLNKNFRALLKKLLKSRR